MLSAAIISTKLPAGIILNAFRGSEFLYTQRMAINQTEVARAPSHHDPTLGEWIGIRAERAGCPRVYTGS